MSVFCHHSVALYEVVSLRVLQDAMAAQVQHARAQCTSATTAISQFVIQCQDTSAELYTVAAAVANEETRNMALAEVE